MTAGAAGSRPLCLIVGVEDDVADRVLVPALEAAGVEAVRAEAPPVPLLLEQLVLAEYAVVDLTGADEGLVFHLGLRHALRPGATALLLPPGARAPIQAWAELAVASPVGAAGAAGAALADLVTRLVAASGPGHDPMSELVEASPPIARLKTDLFRARARYAGHWKERLARARQEGLDAVRVVEHELGPPAGAEAGVLVDLLLSYRSVGAHEQMVSLVTRLPAALARTTMVREQLAFALNRLGRRDEAERILRALIQSNGPSSETNAMLGRVYKDRWDDAQRADEPEAAAAALDQAIEAYLGGFEADWRDALPGINVVTLMEVRDPPDPRRHTLLPLVSYAAERRLASGEADYWDHATRVELAVLAGDERRARRALAEALDEVREAWEPASTANNLRMIRAARRRRGGDEPWAEDIEAALRKSADASAVPAEGRGAEA